MSQSSGKHPRGRTSRAKLDPAAALRDQAVKLYDKGDGHGADWAAAAIAALRVSFFCLQNLPADSADRAAITRRAHDFAYNLLAGTQDSGAAFTAEGDRPPRLAFTMADPAPVHDRNRP